MRNWLSPRATAKLPLGTVILRCTFFQVLASSLSGWLWYAVVLICMLVEMSESTLLITSRCCALLGAFFASCWVWRKQGFSWSNSIEMGIACLVPCCGIWLGGLFTNLALCASGIVMMIHPYTEGPEPDGWEPLFLKREEAQRRAEENRLKGRRE